MTGPGRSHEKLQAMFRQFTMTRRSNPPTRRRGQPNLAAQFEIVHPRIAEATRVASARMTQLGVRHALVGGMASGAYARPHATKDVDFLVGPEAWPSSGKIVSPIAGLPFNYDGVPIDTLLAPSEAPTIEEALCRTMTSEGIPIAPPEVVILMKLIAGRPHDLADADAILSVTPVAVVRAYVAAHAPDYQEDLETLIASHERQDNIGRRIRDEKP